jgi:hypothetical protein
MVLLALLAVAFVFTACNRNGDDDEPTGNVVATPGPQENQPPTDTTGGNNNDEPPVPQVPMGNIHPIIDLGNREIRISSFYLNNLYGAARGAAGLDPLDPEHAQYQMHRLQYDNLRRVEQQFNVRFTSEQSGDWGGHINGFTAAQAAGVPMAEIVRAPGPLITNGLGSGQLVDMAQLVHPMADQGFTFDFHTEQRFIRPALDLHGMQHVFTGAQPRGLSAMFAVNMDLVNRLGLQDPVALYESGNWNWDTFMDIMRQAKMQGYWGIAGSTGNLAAHFSGANDAVFLDDNFNYAATHPNTVEMFQFVQNIFLEELWRYDETTGMLETNYAWANNAFFELADAVFFAEPGWRINLADAPFEFRMIPVPLGPSNTTGTTAHTTLMTGFSIPVGVPNPEEILVVLEELFSWNIGNEWMQLDSVEDGLRARLQTEECVQRSIFHANNTVRPELGWSTIMREHQWMWYDIAWSLISGYEDAATLMESRRPVYQEHMDNLFGSIRR